MNIIYDISVLGLTHHKAQSATGISRVIENLAFALTKTPDCNLIIAAAEHEKGARDYFKITPQLSHLPYSKNRFDAVMTDALSTLDGAIFKPNIVNNAPLRLPLRLLRRSLVAIDAVTKSRKNLIRKGDMKRADVFHSTFFPLPEQIRHARKIKRFQTVYDIIPLTHPEWFSSGEEDILRAVVNNLQKQDYVLAISQATKDDLCNHCHLDPEHIIVTPLAANRAVFYPSHDAEKFRQVREKYEIPERPYVLSLATLEPRKNTEHLIRCFADMVRQQNIADLQLVLTGSRGWQYDSIFEQIEGLNELKDRVIITGRVDDEDLAALYSNALMFAYPSLYEGFGLPPLEAMQCGIPVITSNVSSLPEVVADAGITVSPKDKGSLMPEPLRSL